jgi:hypothetical protein
MLVVFFNLTPEQAESLMPAEDFEPTAPEIPPGLGPPGTENGPPKPEDEKPPEEEEPKPPEPDKAAELERVKAVSDLVRQIAAREIPVEQGKALLAQYDLTESEMAGLFPEGYAPPEPEKPAEVEPPEFTGTQIVKLVESLTKPKEIVKEIEVVQHTDILAKEIRPGTEKIVGEFARDVEDVFLRHARRLLARARGVTEIAIDNIIREADIEKLAAELSTKSRPYIEQQLAQAAEAAISNLPPPPPAPPALPPAVPGGLPTVPRKPPVSIAFNIEDPQAIRYVSDASRQVGTQASESFGKAIRETLGQGFEEGEGLPKLSKRIQDIAEGDLPKWKADQIARTEAGFAQGFGEEMGWMQSGMVDGKYFHLAPGACEWCQQVAREYGSGRPAEGEATPRGAPASSVVVPLGMPFYNQGEHIELPRKDGTGTRKMNFNYRAIPDGKIHPNCRCKMLPILRGGE